MEKQGHFFSLTLALLSYNEHAVTHLTYIHCSVAQSCPTPCNPMDCNTPGFPIHHQLPEFTQTHVHWVSEAIHLVLCCPLLLLPSIFPSIGVFSSKSALCIRWPKYWSFSFSPSNEYSELMSFRIDGFDLLAVQGTLKSLLQKWVYNRYKLLAGVWDAEPVRSGV